mgnify:CR=1 FL=1
MPEEINRITTDHCSTLLFSPTLEGVKNLTTEGINHNIGKHKVYHCGDVMYDNSLYFEGIAKDKSDILSRFDLMKGEFNLVTFHRPSTTDDKENLKSIIDEWNSDDADVGDRLLRVPLPEPKSRTLDVFRKM